MLILKKIIKNPSINSRYSNIFLNAGNELLNYQSYMAHSELSNIQISGSRRSLSKKVVNSEAFKFYAKSRR
jgi:hypothetical protein